MPSLVHSSDDKDSETKEIWNAVGVGLTVGSLVGFGVGLFEGAVVVGSEVLGTAVVGVTEGLPEGSIVGDFEGGFVGVLLGSVGAFDGEDVGDSVVGLGEGSYEDICDPIPRSKREMRHQSPRTDHKFK